jgi:hypothetical protein
MITRQLIVKKKAINYARNCKKKFDVQFLQASRNWKNCSALAYTETFSAKIGHWSSNYFFNPKTKLCYQSYQTKRRVD